jgi:hypothetical protein
MSKYSTVEEAFDAIPWGKCSLCKEEHTFPDVKCDLIYEEVSNA